MRDELLAIPDPCWAFDGDVSIAYQVVGAGPIDLVIVPGLGGHLELFWELPGAAAWFSSFVGTCRLIMFDKRGSGLSQRIQGYPPLEERARDIDVVLESVGSERAVLMGVSEGGTLAAYYAATQPERVAGLIVWGGFARLARSDDYPVGVEADVLLRFVRELVVPQWGLTNAETGGNPSLWGNGAWAEAVARMNRSSLTPTELLRTWELVIEMDVRDLLPAIKCPTLIGHRTGDLVTPVEHGRYMAQHIPGAEYREFAGEDHLPFIDDNSVEVRDTLRDFLVSCGGAKPAPPSDRQLSSVMFTDIVDSTGEVVRQGDAEWSQHLDEHDRICLAEVLAEGGEVIKSTGDGVLAIFPAPAASVRCALSMREKLDAAGMKTRVGIHFGEVERRGEDVAGVAVHVASRIQSAAAPGTVVVSATIRDLVAGSGLRFDPLGSHDLRGVDRSWDLFAALVAR